MNTEEFVEANINEIDLLKNDPNISSETKSAIQNMQSIFLGDFENIRKSFNNSDCEGKSYAITGNEWLINRQTP
jgi:hypothetical protein